MASIASFAPADGGGGRHAERLGRRARLAVLLVAGLLLVGVGLSALLSVGGAVIGSGQVAVESRVKTISHPTGGVLAAVYVRDGDRVRAGQVLMRLDASVSAVDADQSREGLDQLLARRARLEAERDDRAAIAFAPEQVGSADPGAQAAMASERRQFELRRRERLGAVATLRERIHQLGEQIASYRAQITAGDRQSALIAPELAGIRKLYDRQLVTITRRNELERTAVSLEGTRAALGANIAQAQAAIAEAQEQILNVGKNARSEAGTELAQVLDRLNDARVRRAAASSTYDRSTIRAPQAGVIDKLAYATIGSAIPAGQPILQIVPDADTLLIEAMIQPQDIDRLRVGQAARVSFTSLNRQVTPDVPGRVTFISAEPMEDSRSQRSFYRIRVTLDAHAIERDLKGQLVTGMPVEVFVQTGSRSILSFLTKPVRDQMSHAMREE